ncbi:MAG: nuclear transport factor 2 family protein, partial [Myxococcota bacterium]|nr:nuclear transport factor 2 family protein [Myxococcota bacterium]
MRIGIMIAALASLLGACSGETVAQPPPAPVDWRSFQPRPILDSGPTGPTPNERAVAESYTAALESPGVSLLSARLDPDAHFAFPGLHDAHGRDAVVQAHGMLFGAFDQRKFAVARVWRTDSAQSIDWTMTGTQTQAWMGVPSTGKPVAFRGLTILWTNNDGAIKDGHVYFDIAVVKGQLGVGPKDLLNLPPSPPAGGAGTSRVFEQANSAEEKSNILLCRAALDALENNNLPGYLSAVTDDVEVHTLERAQPLRGKDDIRAYFKAMHNAIGRLDTTVENDWGIGPFVIVEYDIAGEQIGPIGWVPIQREKVVRLH